MLGKSEKSLEISEISPKFSARRFPEVEILLPEVEKTLCTLQTETVYYRYAYNYAHTDQSCKLYGRGELPLLGAASAPAKNSLMTVGRNQRG